MKLEYHVLEYPPLQDEQTLNYMGMSGRCNKFLSLEAIQPKLYRIARALAAPAVRFSPMVKFPSTEPVNQVST